MVPFTILMEPVTECLLLGALGALAARCLLQVDLIVFYLVHVLSWFLLDWLMLSVVQVRGRGGGRDWAGMPHCGPAGRDQSTSWQRRAAAGRGQTVSTDCRRTRTVRLTQTDTEALTRHDTQSEQT